MHPTSKGRGAEKAQDHEFRSNVEGPAILSRRVGASASGLLQSSFGRPSPDTITESLASMNTNTSKGGASSSASSDEASSSSQAAVIRKNLPEPSSSVVGGSFRSTHDGGVAAAGVSQHAFNEFVANPELFEPDNEIKLGSLVPSEEPFDIKNEGFRNSREGIEPGYGNHGLDALHIASSNDGAAVVALLSSPTFYIEDEPTNDWDIPAIDKGKPNLGSQPKKQQAYDGTDPPAPSNPLDLMPDFDSSWDPAVPFPSGFQGTRFLDPAFGNIQPWIDILNRYHDEVWGDMLPLVREAREEIKTANSSPEGVLQDRPALRRLGMLLKHLNQPL